MGDSWKSFKTGFARTKQKVLEKVGVTESTVDQRVNQESEKLFVLFKLVKRLKKSTAKYEDILKNIIILQNEIAQDILALKDSDPNFIAYQDSQIYLDKERARITELLETYYHDPLRDYLSQFKEIKSRLAELEVRRVDMDRYHRDYTIKANKGKDQTSLSKTEGKHTKTKESYQSLLDELLRDMQALFEDRKPVFDPVFSNFLNRNAEFYEYSSQCYRNLLPLVSGINEYDAGSRTWVITSVDDSAMTKNIRSGAVFTTSPKDYQSPGGGRSRASTVGASPTERPTFTPPPQSGVSLDKTSPPTGQEDLAYNSNNYVSQPVPQHNMYPQVQQPPQPHYTVPSESGVTLEKKSPPPFAPMYPQVQQPTGPTPTQQPTTAKFGQMNLNPTGGTAPISANNNRKSMYSPGQQPTGVQPMFLKKPAAATGSGRPLPTPKSSAPSNLQKGEALYDFTGMDSTELTFKKGDIITFHKATGDWYEGELNGTRGLVPGNYIKLN